MEDLNPTQYLNNVRAAETVRISPFVNLYGCRLGDGTFVGPFVEIQNGVVIGRDCRIQSHTFICSDVTIGDRVFIGHGVMFCNDKNPVAGNKDWLIQATIVNNDVSIGSGAVILPGVTIGAGAVIGAGSVVTKDVPAGETWYGNPARKKDESSPNRPISDKPSD